MQVDDLEMAALCFVLNVPVCMLGEGGGVSCGCISTSAVLLAGARSSQADGFSEG